MKWDFSLKQVKKDGIVLKRVMDKVSTQSLYLPLETLNFVLNSIKSDTASK